jgi:hypothetical protein
MSDENQVFIPKVLFELYSEDAEIYQIHEKFLCHLHDMNLKELF